MEFGIFSNGFRLHTTAAQTYDEDLAEIVYADQLGFRYAFISEHHGEPVYIDKVDTLPVPELLMCKAAALTKQIRMGAAVKLIHLTHPLDTAIHAAVTDHVIGGGRYIFGYGSGSFQARCSPMSAGCRTKKPSRTAARSRSISS